MNMSILEESHRKLIEHLEEVGYSPITIHRYEYLVGYVLQRNGEGGMAWKSYGDVRPNAKNSASARKNGGHVLHRVFYALIGAHAAEPLKERLELLDHNEPFPQQTLIFCRSLFIVSAQLRFFDLFLVNGRIGKQYG